MRIVLAMCLIILCGCEQLRRNGMPGDSGYIEPRFVQVKVIQFEPDLIMQIADRPVIRNAYSVVEDEDGKRYRVVGKVGPVGDTFQMDVSLMRGIGE